ncbi:MAG: hypothetical protein ACJA2S_005543 [Cyclobacteriaceae bacterium]|jgi:hypothetical protein
MKPLEHSHAKELTVVKMANMKKVDRSIYDLQRSDMALWPPSLINTDKSSLSAGAIKVSSTQCAIQIKNSH